MFNYDKKLNDLLKKYNLYKEFDLDITNIVDKYIKEKLDTKKKYLLYGDLLKINTWQGHFKIFSKINVVGIVLEENYKEIDTYYNINIYRLNDIKEIEYDEIIIISKYDDFNYIKNIDKPKINIYECVPEDIKEFKKSYYGNIIYKYISENRMLLSSELRNELEEFYKNIEIINTNISTTIIWGAGEHTINLLNNTNIKNKLNIKYIVDKNEEKVGKIINGIKVISFDELSKVKFDAFFISSFEYRKDIRNEIIKNYSSKYIIDMYKNNYEYKFITKFKIKSKILNKKNNKEKILKKLIILYLFIRDFYNASKCINEYIEKKYINYNELNKFNNELDLLLKDVLYKNKSSKYNNIHLIIIDALDKVAVDNNMKFLKKFADENISYERAYSPSTYTTESHLCMFSGENLYNEKNKKIYIRKYMLKDECNFIREIEDKGYTSYCNNIRPIVENIFENKIGDDNINNPMSKMLWENICCNLDSLNTKKFTYTRIMEYHDFLNISYEKAAKYIDEQLKYYNQFLPEKDYVFITADHGSGYYEGKEIKINIPLIIKTPQNIHDIKENLFSTKDIGKKIINILNEDYMDDQKDYIVIERTAIHNESLKIFYYYGNIDIKKYVQSFRIIKTLTEKYIVFEDGSEEYYLNNNDNINLIYDKRYKNNINKLRSLNKKILNEGIFI